MNNSQFRKLVLDTPARQAGTSEGTSRLGATPRRDGATPSALGSRMRSSIPMTPRSVGGVDFARQLAEQRSLASSSQPQKKFRSSAAPKGVKLAEGYVDRAKAREEQREEDDKAERVKALEEMVKLQQIDETTFVKLRDEILGGDVGSTHLVKGLDWKLLQRVKRGEDVLNGEKKDENGKEGDEEDVDVDEEFDELENMEVHAVKREEHKKKGEMAPPSLIPGKKRNRDQILAELKAARKAAQEAKAPSLGAKFKKVGERRAESRIERDNKGREVLITIDEHGNEKRKVRKVQIESEVQTGHGLQMPDKDAKPLGMVVPEAPKVPEVEEDFDIFDDAGDDYDPLAGLEEDDSDSDVDEVPEATKDEKSEASTQKKVDIGNMAPPPRPKQHAVSRNYFGESPTDPEPASSKPLALQDPTILAALKKASTLNPLTKEAESAEEAAREAKRKKMLQQDDRDAEDMDMGFGSSRFADEEDFEDRKIKLSEWGGRGSDEDGDGKGEGKGKRKRGPKKRKGDGNNAADVLNVLERRKTAES